MYKKLQFFLRMKLIVMSLLICCLQLSAKVYSQPETTSLTLENASLESVLTQLEKQTSYKFVYSTSMFPESRVNLSYSNAPVSTILGKALKNTGLSWKMLDNNMVAIIESRGTKQAVIKGKVTDEKNVSLPGVNVSIKGTKIVSSTDDEGMFTLELPSREETIVFKFIGFKTKEQKVVAGETMRVRLEPEINELQNVVVTGMFSRPAESFTGSARIFTAEDLAKVSNGNILNALSALDPSFQVPDDINLGSNPNALPEVVLRGGNSLTDIGQTETENPFNYQSNPNTPLFVLDGFEVSLQRISDLDMNRIARVNILKDAGATAIYGSRAANGVIVIETIRPKEGQLRFSYSGNFVVESPDLNGYDLLDARGKMELETLAGVYSNTWNFRQDELDIIKSARLAAIESGVNTDWLAKPLESGIGQKHNIYVEGGASSVLYGVNLTYDQRSGVMKESGRQNVSGNTYLSYRVNKFQFRNELTLNFNKGKNSPYGSFTQYTRLNPYWSPTNADGSQKLYLEEIRDPQSGRVLTNFNAYDNLDGRSIGRAVNPLYNASLNTLNQSTYQNLINNFSILWQAQPWLRLNGRFSYQRQSDESDLFLPAQHTSFVTTPTFEKGSYRKGYGKQNNFEGFFSADVNKIIGHHSMFGTLSANVLQNQFNTEAFTVEGFPNPSLDQLILGNQFPLNSKPTGEENLKRLIGVVGNFSYAYDARFLLDLSYRLDGSSQFGSENRIAPFWSVGTGWNLHNESFIKSLNAVDRLRLRYTIGYTGSQNFPSYLGVTTSQYYTDSEYRGVISPFLLGYGNAELAWQKTLKNNIGVDMTLFNRLDINGNYFIEKTEGSIGVVSTALSTGFNEYFANIGDLKSTGFELNTRFMILKNDKRRDNWSVFVNLFKVKTEIQKVSNTIEAMNNRANTTVSNRPIVRYAEGQSPTAIWAVPSLGIDPATGNEIFLTRDGKITENYSPLDQRISGDTRPELQGTFGSTFEVKGIGANIFFRFGYGGQAYNQTLVDKVENVLVSMYNVDKRVLEERWKSPGDLTFFKGLSGTSASFTAATSRFVQDDNFLNCESISLFYRLPDAANRKLGLQNTRISLYNNDVFRFSSIKRERGLDYPFSHTVTLQLQASF